MTDICGTSPAAILLPFARMPMEVVVPPELADCFICRPVDVVSLMANRYDMLGDFVIDR